MTKYYAFGAQRVAMRQCNSSGCADAMYLHGDHPSLCSGQALGSVSLVTDSTGNVVSQARYTPYGEVRWPGVSQMPTDFGYTGQRADSFGLMDYNARFYSPHLGRFVSADSIVPNPGKAVDFDRFAYSANNPLRYIDPSGHGYCDSEYADPEECEGLVGFDDDYMKILVVLIAMESTSGMVPDEVNYMKAWALLNLRTVHRDAGFYFTPFRDWRNHESKLLSDYGVTGTLEEQMANLLARYENYASGENDKISAKRFAEIEAQVRNAASDWYKYGRNSDEDPVNGATGFWDAAGMRYPDGKETDEHLQDKPNYESVITTDYEEMLRFRNVFTDNLVVSEVYKISTWSFTGEAMYTFTVFHCPCQ